MTGAMVTRKDDMDRLATALAAARPRIAMVLPPRMSPDRIISVAQNMYARDPNLGECEPGSVVRAVIQAAELGLDLSPKLGQCFLVPRNVKRGGTWVKVAELQIGWKGALAKAYESDRILSIDVELVHANDRFEMRRGTHPDVIHEPAPEGERGAIVGGYVAARLAPPDAVPPVWKVVHMTIAEIEAIRDHADSYRKWKSAKDNGKAWHPPPWVEHFGEMSRKTLMIRACKTLPIGDSFRAALEADADDFRATRREAQEPSKRVEDMKGKLRGEVVGTSEAYSAGHGKVSDTVRTDDGPQPPHTLTVDAELEDIDPDEGP